jgi:drug/metabolite transporter (DMT)-like permease
MFTYGTVPLLTHFIALPSSLTTLFRCVIGLVCMLFYKLVIKREKFDFKAIKNNFIPLLLCGLFLGLNWIALFASYDLVGAAIGTVFNYFAPVLIFIVGTILFKYKLSIKKIICILCALLGLLFVMGIFNGAISSFDPFGLLVASATAFTYCGLVIANKYLKPDLSINDRVIFSLLFASIVSIPFTLTTVDFSIVKFEWFTFILLAVLGLFHTAFAYILYFLGMSKLDTQSIAIFSYIEPVVSIILSIFILQESFTIFTIIGSVLIIGSALFSDIDFNFLFKRKNKNSGDLEKK